MPIERLGHLNERQKERAHKAIDRVALMISEVEKTIERYSLIDDTDDEIKALQDFVEAGYVLQGKLTIPGER